MRLFRTAMVFGVGYALGHPAARQQLTALGQRMRSLAERPDIVDWRQRKWAQMAATLRLPGAADGPAAAWSGGLRAPRERRFPRHTASSRPDQLTPPPPSYPPPDYAAPPTAAMPPPASTPSAAPPTGQVDRSVGVVPTQDRDVSMPGRDRGETP